MTTARKIVVGSRDIRTFPGVVARMTAGGIFGLDIEGCHDQGSS